LYSRNASRFSGYASPPTGWDGRPGMANCGRAGQAAVGLLWSAGVSATPLNVLLITSDQHRWDALGVCNPMLKTPALDRLAREGILFDRAYTCNPVCTPARVSILTGHYPSKHGCYTIGTSLPEDYPTVPARMTANGCFTALCGKAHFQPCTNQPLGDNGSLEAPPRSFDWDFFRRWSGPYYGFQHARLAIAHTHERNAGSMHYGLWLRDQGVDLNRYFGTGRYTDWGRWNLPEEWHNSRWTADETIAALDRARNSGKPFFLWSSFQDPHNPCVVPKPWDTMYRPEEMPDYRHHPGEFDDKPPFYQAVYEWEKRGEKLGDPDLDGAKPWYCFRGIPFMNERATRELAACYFGMVSLMDHHIGRILAHLDTTGLRDNTVVLFTTDHGDYLGNHGLWWKGLPAYDDAQRLPFIVRHPRCQTPGARSRAFQSLVDIGPSALAAMGLNAPAGLQGINQLPAWQNAGVTARDWALCEFRPTESPFMQKTFVRDRWKLVVYHDRPYGELYDMESDPDQYRNLWGDAGYQTVRAELAQRLLSAEMEKDGTLTPRVAWA